MNDVMQDATGHFAGHAALFNYFRNRRFLIVLGAFQGIGGAERQALILGRFLKREVGAQVTFVASHGGRLVEDKLDALGIEHLTIPFGDSRNPARNVRKIARLILTLRRQRPDFIIPFVTYNSKVIGLIWKLTGAQYAMWNQRDEGRDLYGSRLERFALRNVCDIVSNSYAGREGLAAKCGVNPEDVVIINNGIVVPDKKNVKPFWHRELGLPASTLLVAMIANLTRYKDHDTLLRAWKIVEERSAAADQPVALVLAGSYGKTADKLKVLSFDLRLRNLYMPGSVNDVDQLIRESNLIVHSSRLEGCPNGVLEAMALGKPVVGTDIPGFRQAIGTRHAEQCMAAPGNVEELAERIFALLEDKDLRLEIGTANRKRIESEFSVEKMGFSFLSLIRDKMQQELTSSFERLRSNAVRGIARLDCRRLRKQRRVALGWTVNLVGGVKNHLRAIRKHSSYRAVILPSDMCIRISGGKYLPRLLESVITPSRLALFDIVHSHVDPWFVQQCSEARSSYGTPWVHTYHTLYFPDDWGGCLKPWQREANRHLLETASRADVCLSVSRWLQAHLAEEHGIQTVYMPNGIDFEKCQAASPERFSNRYGVHQFALFVGTGARIKNPVAFVKLAHRFPEHPFVMIGRKLSVDALAADNGGELPQNLIVLGALPHSTVLDALAACRVFVITSRSEGLPTVLMEAMALNKPVVGSNRFGIEEVLGGEQNGYLYDFDDFEDLTVKFEAALIDEGGRSQAGRERVQNEYTWSRLATGLDAVYGNLLT